MDNPQVVIYFILGWVIVTRVSLRLLPADGRIIGRLILVLILASPACLLLSMGGTGIALAANNGGLAYVLEGVAVVSGFAALGSSLLALLYGLVRFLVWRAAGAGSR
jgi:hypothetical protein